MNTTKLATIAATLTGLFAIQAPMAHGDEETYLLAMQPLQAVNFDRGDEHLVGYYMHESGRCRLSVTRASSTDLNAPSTFAATRFEAVVDAGASTRYVSPNGHAFEFACAADALAMNVKPLEQVASANEH
jgi:hypothetical protein